MLNGKRGWKNLWKTMSSRVQGREIGLTYISSKIKSYFSFIQRYIITNLGLNSYNKKFLYTAVGALGSTHDAQNTSTYVSIQKNNKWRAIPDHQLVLRNFITYHLLLLGTALSQSFLGRWRTIKEKWLIFNKVTSKNNFVVPRWKCIWHVKRVLAYLV